MRPLPFALAAVLLWAGCVSDGPTPTAAAATSAMPGDETGALKAQVVTAELQPVAGAQVLLQGREESLFTDEQGEAMFQGLDVGEYTLVAAKPGFKALESRGRVATVAAGETTTVKLTLDPLVVIDATTSYHLTSPFRGMVSCSFSGGGSATSACGRGVAQGGSSVRDPNENSVHTIQIDNALAYTHVLEAKWQPTIGALPSELHLSSNKEYRCTPGCVTDGQIFFVGGKSPLYGTSSPTSQLSAYFGKTAADFPKPAYIGMRAYCPAGCNAMFVFQQTYEGFSTVFYGEPAPADFRVLPTS